MLQHELSEMEVRASGAGSDRVQVFHLALSKFILQLTFLQAAALAGMFQVARHMIPQPS
jgi:hypothetical protein